MEPIVNSSQYFVSEYGIVRFYENSGQNPFFEGLTLFIQKLIQHHAFTVSGLLSRGGVESPETFLGRVMIVAYTSESFPDKVKHLKYIFSNSKEEGNKILESALRHYNTWKSDTSDNDEIKREVLRYEIVKKTKVKKNLVGKPQGVKGSKALIKQLQSTSREEYIELQNKVLSIKITYELFRQKLLEIYEEYDMPFEKMIAHASDQHTVRFKRLYSYLLFSKFNSMQTARGLSIELNALNHSTVTTYIKQHVNGTMPEYDTYLKFTKSILERMLTELLK